MVREMLYVTTGNEWREWLEKNHDTQKEIWLLLYKKHTNKRSIPYENAVEQALCFGWIDSIVRRIDDEKYAQKYTPRKKRSVWSELNKTRATKMMEQGLLTQAGFAKIRQAKENGEWFRNRSAPDSLSITAALEKALAAHEDAMSNFENFPPSYRKQTIGWITSAKKKETREKRIEETVKLAARNKKLGMK